MIIRRNDKQYGVAAPAPPHPTGGEHAVDRIDRPLQISCAIVVSDVHERTSKGCVCMAYMATRQAGIRSTPDPPASCDHSLNISNSQFLSPRRTCTPTSRRRSAVTPAFDRTYSRRASSTNFCALSVTCRQAVSAQCWPTLPLQLDSTPAQHKIAFASSPPMHA